MEPIEAAILKFDNQIEDAHRKIDATIRVISDADAHIHRHLLDFQNDINSLNIEGENLFEKELSEILRQYKSGCTKWCEMINSLLEGKEFINQFEKSVLVVVFGNVNVGKSSVGNFIAGVCDAGNNKKDGSKDKEILNHFFGKPPVFYEYDLASGDRKRGSIVKTDSYFKEGYVETTANIQYFTRHEGLTWTDSPGIASVNKANGDLAKKYVEFADLVIFITTSSSPGKNDEIQELKSLFGKKKPVLILINKSDKHETDEIDGQIVQCWVPKSSGEREKQEQYVQQAFREAASDIIAKLDAVSISTYLAMDALRENNAELFFQSGFPRFYEKLGKLFEKNAVELKMDAPRQRVNAVIDEIITGRNCGTQPIGGISSCRQHLEKMRKEIGQAKEKIRDVSQKAMPEIINRCMTEAQALIREQAYKVRKGEAVNDISQSIDQIVTQCTSKILWKEFCGVLADYDNNVVKHEAYHGTKEICVNAKKEQAERFVFNVKMVPRNPDGLIEHIQHFFFGKEFSKEEIHKRRVTETFINGDNSSDVMGQVQAEIGRAVEDYTKSFAHNVQTQYFKQVEAIIGEIMRMLIKLENNLRGEKISNGRNCNSGL